MNQKSPLDLKTLNYLRLFFVRLLVNIFVFKASRNKINRAKTLISSITTVLLRVLCNIQRRTRYTLDLS